MSILKAFNFFGQKGYWQLAKGFKNGMKLSMSKEAIGEKLSVITTFNPGNFASKNRFTRALFDTMGKGIALSKVDGFGTYMLTAGLGGAAIGTGIGYLLGNASSDDNDMQGLVVEKEEKKEEAKVVPAKKQAANTEKPVATVEKSREKNYHSISTGGLSWASIVTAYYPELVEKHDGKLYGENGAIRELKLALSKDNDKLDLINSSDIPKTLNLPMEINGAKINEKGEAQKVKIKNGGHTDIAEAGKRDSIDVYTIKDESKNVKITDIDSTKAINRLKNKPV